MPYFEETARWATEQMGAFTHAVCTQYEDYKDFLGELHSNDFISQTYVGEIDFCHITKVENIESIKANGLVPSSDYVGALGSGIYVVEENSELGWKNIVDYLVDDYYAFVPVDAKEAYAGDISEEVALVRGKFIGKYIECKRGEGYEGYIVLKQPTYCALDSIEITTLGYLATAHTL